MSEPMDPKNVDKRTAARYVRAGLLDEKAYEKHLKSLTDVSDKASAVDTTMADSEAEEEGSEEDAAE